MRCCLLTKKKIEQHRGPAHRGVEYWCGVVYWLYVHPPQNPGSEFRVYGLGFFFWLYECPAQYPGSRFDVFLVRLLCVYCVFIVCVFIVCLLCVSCVHPTQYSGACSVCGSVYECSVSRVVCV